MFNRKFVSAVIVAAGTSSRMQSNVSKQLMNLGGRTVIENTTEKFRKCGCIDEIVVVCPPGDEDLYKDLLGDDIIVTGGGSARQQSVFNGVSAAGADSDLIAIHDGARPLVDVDDIERVVSDGEKYGAATLAVPVKDTVKIVMEDTVAATPDRNTLYAIQTPQVFYRNDYLKAYAKAAEDNVDYTDDCQLIESLGGTVHITEGKYTNIKITTPEDIDIAEVLMRRSETI